MEAKPCIFCGKTGEKHQSDRDAYGFECERCGDFFISDDLALALNALDKNFSLPQRVRCISANVRASESGIRPFWFRDREAFPATEYLSQFTRAAPFSFNEEATRYIAHSEKPNRLLLRLAEALAYGNPSSKIGITQADMDALAICDHSELAMWVNQLVDDKFLHSFELEAARNLPPLVEVTISTARDFTITAKGWTRVESLTSRANSRDVFIAMKFNWDGWEQVVEAIKIACRKFDLNAFIVKEEEHNDSITDKILAAIHRAKFVIADFTYNNQGVYYEAGYAEGLGLPVISTVMDAPDHLGKLHFDRSHINHVAWKTTDELRERLINRIQHTIKL